MLAPSPSRSDSESKPFGQRVRTIRTACESRPHRRRTENTSLQRQQLSRLTKYLSDKM